MHGYSSQPNTSMKTHLLKHRNDKRREKRCGGYSQPNTYKTIQWIQNSHPKAYYRHDKRKEKRYVVVTHSL